MESCFIVIGFAQRLCIWSFLYISLTTISQPYLHMSFSKIGVGGKCCFEGLDRIFIIAGAAVDTAQDIVNLGISW